MKINTELRAEGLPLKKISRIPETDYSGYSPGIGMFNTASAVVPTQVGIPKIQSRPRGYEGMLFDFGKNPNEAELTNKPDISDRLQYFKDLRESKVSVKRHDKAIESAKAQGLPTYYNKYQKGGMIKSTMTPEEEIYAKEAEESNADEYANYYKRFNRKQGLGEEGITSELLSRQAYKESTFNPRAVSKAGYKGLTQIGTAIISDYEKDTGNKDTDPFNMSHAIAVQKYAMDNIYNKEWVNKPNQSDKVRLAKTLAAYNWGPGRMKAWLGKKKAEGIDIYSDSLEWVDHLPEETRDYVNKILLQSDEAFNEEFKRASSSHADIMSHYDSKITELQKGGVLNLIKQFKNDK